PVVATDTARLLSRHLAQAALGIRRTRSRDPDAMVTIFDDGVDAAADVFAERVVLETPQLRRRADPQRAVCSAQERKHDRTEWRRLTGSRPRREPHAVVLDQA